MNHQLSLVDDAIPAVNLFVGLSPDESLRTAILAHRRRWSWPRGTTLSARALLHLTLHYMGPVHVDQVQPLIEKLGEVEMNEMRLVLRAPELWEVAVLRADENVELRALHSRIAIQLCAMGLRICKRLTPHVTLARQGVQGAIVPSCAEPLVWTARHFNLIWSVRSPRAEHRVLASYGCNKNQRQGAPQTSTSH
jgi:2'-5' RNA ligase